MPRYALALLPIAGAALCGAARVSASHRPHDARDLVARLGQAEAQVRDYEVRGVTTSGRHKERFHQYFKRPHMVRLDTPDGQVTMQPNGDVRGRLGHGLFGHISRGLSRDDRRLRDAEGIPFYEEDFPDVVARIQRQIDNGATSSVADAAGAEVLVVRSGETEWQYEVDPATLAFRGCRRSVHGVEAESTQYSAYRANIGLKDDAFKF